MDKQLSASLAAAAADFDQVLKSGELQKWWRALDRNGNGLVSLGEVIDFTRQRYPALAHGVTVKEAFNYATEREGDGDPYLDQNELPSLLRNMIYFTHVRHLCDAADKDGDERLSVSEFAAVALELGAVTSLDQAQEAFEVADTDGSGAVRLDELCNWAAEACCPISATRSPVRTLRSKNTGVVLRLNVIQVSLLNDLNYTGEQSVHVIASLGKHAFTSGKLTRPACVYRWSEPRGSGIVCEFRFPSLHALATCPPMYVRVFQTECKIQDARLQTTHRKLVATRELGKFTLSNVRQMVRISEGTISALESTKLIDSTCHPERVLRKSHLRVECSWKSAQPGERSCRPRSAPTTPRRLDLAGSSFFSARRAECGQCPASARQLIGLQQRLGEWC
eukprot:gnl/MRDRNA2_/MRDRNA2_121563_c0_seq1.p1 gnl/MRDRNA2_/MRDRNA2_121563_c0~~gnl/MRDRNA2_/MRDRNA2_121563_c0_seq1.p1  ORF type:complete len:393 (-),score=55.50 gnl/MRDRNA2_/MRDRNA2_121563_c0_seq1:90-1268(-)